METVERYRMFKSGKTGGYFQYDKQTKRQTSLHTKDRESAVRLINAANEKERTPMVNRQIGLIYLASTDPDVMTRTWSDVITSYRESRKLSGSSLDRLTRAGQAKGIAPLLNRKIIDTKPQEFLHCLNSGGVSVNIFLRRWHNHALEMDWLPKRVLPNTLWPKVRRKIKRAITLAEHQALKTHIENEEWLDYLETLWWTGGAQMEIATLTGERISLESGVISFQRVKLESKGAGKTLLMMGPTLREIMNRRWNEGPVFPYLASIRTTDRATYFRRYCERTGIGGEVTLHCYRYAVAERMHAIGFNQRFSQALLGHSTDRNHNLYAKGAVVEVPCLETSEIDFKLERQNGLKLLPKPASHELKDVG